MTLIGGVGGTVGWVHISWLHPGHGAGWERFCSVAHSLIHLLIVTNATNATFPNGLRRVGPRRSVHLIDLKLIEGKIYQELVVRFIGETELLSEPGAELVGNVGETEFPE